MADVESFPHCELRRLPRKPIVDAVAEIARCLNILPAEARATLVDALASGRIKAYWRARPDYSISADRWPRAQIELSRQIVILADGNRMAFVDLDRDDYSAWLASIASPAVLELPPKGKRYVGDDELVTEAVDGLKAGRWPNANQAASELAKRASGPATERSKADRLYRKIQAARPRPETSRNIPNDGSTSKRK